MVAANSEDASSSRRSRPAASEALSQPGALRGDAGGCRQDDGGLPWSQRHRAVHPGRHEYCKFHNTKDACAQCAKPLSFGVVLNEKKQGDLSCVAESLKSSSKFKTKTN